MLRWFLWYCTIGVGHSGVPFRVQDGRGMNFICNHKGCSINLRVKPQIMYVTVANIFGLECNSATNT